MKDKPNSTSTKEITEKRKERYIQMTAAGLLLMCVLVIYLLNPELYSRIWMLATSGDMHTVLAVLRSYGPWAMFISFVIDVLINILGFLPSIFISTANGIIFGLIPGILISWLAETVGVVLSFWLMRYLLRDTAEKLIISQSKFLLKLDDFSGKNGFMVMLIARSIPYFPSGVITAFGAISRISSRDYILANLIGKLPSVALEVIVGYDVVNFGDNQWRLFIVGVVAISVYLGIWFIYKRLIVNKQKNR